MRYKFVVILVYLVSLSQVFAQDNSKPELDSLYREDQLYIGVNLNFLTNTPLNATRKGISSGMRAGFLRDFPISKSRRVAIAIGLGLSYNQFRNNLIIQKQQGSLPTSFSVIDSDIAFNKNRFSMAVLEMPVEFRFRTSSPSQYDFFRLYTGVTIGYAFWHKALFVTENTIISATQIPEFNNLRIGATLSVGYDSFNAFLNYDVTPFFKNATTLSQEEVAIQAFKVGMIFYIL